jgi:leader peptidase (prepilin peptidase)/N-methyltransferase
MIIVFLFGLAIGSFLNVVIYRLDDLLSIVSERSHCMKCKKTIPWYDLLPLLSFVLLKGKCRNCSNKISLQYPLVELTIGILAVLFYLYFGVTVVALFYFIVFVLLAVVFIVDIKTQMIPEEFVWGTLILSLLGSWYFGGFGVLNMIYGGIIGGIIPGLLVLISKEKWMGSGDIKIGLLLGLLVGFYGSILMIFSSFILGSLVGVALMVLKRKKLKDTLPFAPFLIASGLLTLLWGDYIINWYLGNFYL